MNSYPDIGKGDDDFTLKLDLNIPEKTLIHVDKIALAHVIHNLMKNAYEAMIVNDVDKENILTATASVKGKTLTFTLTDTGCGIPERMLKKIMMPFVTTKTTGTGVGLYFCKQILDRMDIDLSLTSKENIGTSVTLKIPAR